MIYCIIGPSGCGKSTVVEKLCEKGLKAVDSYTTRPKRTPDEKGHTFITENEYQKLEHKVAWVTFNGYNYCVTKEMLDNSDLYIIDPDGIKTLYDNYDKDKIVAIGLKLDPLKCMDRMYERGDSEADVLRRINHDAKMFENFEEKCDYVVDASLPVEEVANKIYKYIKENS